MSALETRSFDRYTYSAYAEASTLIRTKRALLNLGDLNKCQQTYLNQIIRHRLNIARTAPKLNQAA